MEIGKINAKSSVNADKNAKNKPLANLFEPIKDTFTFSGKLKKDSPLDLATKEIEEMKDTNGNKRFHESEILDFKLAFSANNIDVETVKAFKDNTNFDMQDMKNLYAMRRDTKDDAFYDKVNSAMEKLPKGAKPDHFKQNEFEPKKEFSFQLSPENMDELYKEVDKNYPLGQLYKFSAESGDIIEKSVRKAGQEVVDGLSNLVVRTKTTDFRNNTVSTSKRTFDVEKANFVLEEQKVVKNDKNGKMLREEVMTPSAINGVYDVKYTYANGKTKQVSKATVDPKTGIKTIKKDMKSENGTRTQFLYEDDPQGNRIVDYRVTDKNGKILMSNSQSFEVVDENHFISSKNGYKYDITTDENKLTVKDLHHNTETSIDFKKKCKGNKEELINLLKQVPGEELFETVESIKTITSKGGSGSASASGLFSPLTKNIDTGDDLYVFLHELGHAKDAQTQKSFKDKFLNDSQRYTNSEDIQNTYFKEREIFNKYHSDDERKYVSYFTRAKGHYGGVLGGLSEIVAETNAITNTFTDGKINNLGARAQYLQQHFPETIAKIRDAMNIKDDVTAIEYYGA